MSTLKNDLVDGEMEKLVRAHLHRYRTLTIPELRRWIVESRKSCGTWPRLAYLIEKFFGEGAGFRWGNVPSEEELHDSLKILAGRGEAEEYGGKWRLGRIGSMMKRLYHREQYPEDYWPPPS